MERERALRSFRTGETPILVATDVAARGLDIPNVMHVINYDLPHDIDDYVHRIGRTGRAGNYGYALAFFNEKNKSICRDLVDLFSETGQFVPEWIAGLADELAKSGHKVKKKRGRYYGRDSYSGFGNNGGGFFGNRSNYSFGQKGDYGNRRGNNNFISLW